MEALDVEQANKICWNIAARVSGRLPEVSADDISQTIWLWIVEHQAQILDWPDEEWVRRLYWRGYRLAWAYARKERARIVGYEIPDEYFYRLGTLRKLLPLYYAEADEEEMFVPDRDAAADIERALTMVDVYTSSLLFQVFSGDDAEGQTAALAVAWGTTEGGARMKVQRALRALQDALGGPDPYREGTGEREVLSNARARVITGRQYGQS
jgi:hypothetical protein